LRDAQYPCEDADLAAGQHERVHVVGLDHLEVKTSAGTQRSG
jgi:hypothetical protein